MYAAGSPCFYLYRGQCIIHAAGRAQRQRDNLLLTFVSSPLLCVFTGRGDLWHDDVENVCQRTDNAFSSVSFEKKKFIFREKTDGIGRCIIFVGPQRNCGRVFLTIIVMTVIIWVAGAWISISLSSSSAGIESLRRRADVHLGGENYHHQGDFLFP